MNAVAYRVKTPRLMLRCWQPQDAPERRALIDSSDAQLRPFIPWMRDEPLSLSETAQRLRAYRADFDSDRAWRFAVLRNTRLIGDVGLFPRVGPDALEVGYLLGSAYTGHGYATEAVSALIRVAFELAKVDRVEIRCDPRNDASIRLANRLNFSHEATLPRRHLDEHNNHIDLMIWAFYRQAYTGSRIAAQPVLAVDAVGVVLLGSADILQ